MPTWRFRSLSFSACRLSDRFWRRWQEQMATVGLSHQWEQTEATGSIENFRRCANGESGGFQGLRFNDSDVYKLLEATAYGSAIGISPRVKSIANETIDLIAASQTSDGYINSHVHLTYPENKWLSLNSMHEMYCIGHLIEAGVATNDGRLLDVGVKAAEHVCATFGPNARLGYPGHPEIELALARLSAHLKEDRFSKTARWMVESRGHRPSPFEAELCDSGTAALSPGSKPLFFHDGSYCGAYAQDDRPLAEQTRAVGHAVRAMYLYCGAVDTLRDVRIGDALKSIWKSLVGGQTYVTGGIGSSGKNEGFTDEFDLPNKDAYAETCAGIGLVMWAWRMFLWTGCASYMDVMERALYNAVLSGVSLTCDRYFYDNPLESDGSHARSPWFECACCPPNIARLVLSVGAYCVAEAEGEVFVALPVAGSFRTSVADVVIEGDAPWSGDYSVSVIESRGLEAISLRVPEWTWGMEVWVNGSPVSASPVDGVVTISREWRAGDVLRVSCAMPCQWLVAHDRALDCAGRVALRRGPLVYCLEGVDLGFFPHHWCADSGGGVGVLGRSFDPLIKNSLEVAGWRDSMGSSRLYSPHREGSSVPATARFVPYFSWANRENNGMQVWVRGGVTLQFFSSCGRD